MSFSAVQKETTILHVVGKLLPLSFCVLILNLLGWPALVQVTNNILSGFGRFRLQTQMIQLDLLVVFKVVMSIFLEHLHAGLIILVRTNTRDQKRDSLFISSGVNFHEDLGRNPIAVQYLSYHFFVFKVLSRMLGQKVLCGFRLEEWRKEQWRIDQCRQETDCHAGPHTFLGTNSIGKGTQQEQCYCARQVHGCGIQALDKSFPVDRCEHV
mmetsp:Transcript_17786/g.36578  ORF Transcript_17786/g.36578 Transcript_17786/m.36578 type:complete len:211 (-) Transcript_17786:380-1012(-)